MFLLPAEPLTQCGFAILPLRVPLIDFGGIHEEGGAYRYWRHRDKGIAQRQHSKKTLMFDALEWRSMVEFRPGHAPAAQRGKRPDYNSLV